MATDVIGSHTDEPSRSEIELIATTISSTLTETEIHDDFKIVEPQMHENATDSHNFNAANFTTTTSTQLLNRNVTENFVEGSLPSTWHSENLTFSQENVTSLSQLVTSSSSSTFLPVTPVKTSSVVENVQTLSSDSFNTTISSVETTLEHLSDVDVQPASTVGIAVGVAVGGFILLALIVVVVVFLVRRRRTGRKKMNKVVIENPRYALPRDSTLPRNFDLTMHTGPMMRNQMNNNSVESLGRTNGRRKKEAPQPPIYRPLGGKDSGSKRKAPSPPTRLGEVEYEDLYEKDSVPGSTEGLELTTFLTADNCNADPIVIDSKTSHSQPLLESFKPGKKSPKRSSRIDSGEQPQSPKRSSKIDSGEQPPVAVDDSIKQEDSIKDEDEIKDDDEQMKTALLGKTNADSSLSIDSYDRAKNPFFGE